MHLYAAFLGGPLADGRMGEGHEVVFVVAPDLAQAKIRADAKWSGTGRGHVDALQRIEMVDGYEVSLVAGGIRRSVDPRRLQLMDPGPAVAVCAPSEPWPGWAILP